MTRTHSTGAALALSTLAALGLAALAPGARAQTTLSGPHDNTGGFGYDAKAGAYTVTPTATFDNNGLVGLVVENAGTTATVNGGQFDNNGDTGLYAYNGSTVTIEGGQFTGDAYGLNAQVADISVYGGVFSGNTDDILVSRLGDITLYGTFPTYGALPSGGASGTFTGTLANEAAPQTFQYVNYGTLTLAPEPSQFAGLGIGLLGLGGLALKNGVKARKKA